MVLRCPRCSELKFFGRTQVLGDLVVCPKCQAVFEWRPTGTGQSEAAGAAPEAPDARPSDRQR
jgi:uncharacterized C2H2 Zn-finger protein